MKQKIILLRKQVMERICFCMLAMILSVCVQGCGALAQDSMEKPQIQELENHLAIWQKELPQDTKPEGLNANAIRGIEVQKEGEKIFAVSYEQREEKESFDYWDISIPYQSLVSVNTEELYSLFGTVALMGWTKAEGITPEEAGLLDSTSSVFLAYNKEQKDEKTGEAEPDSAATILIGDKDGKGSYYVMLKGSNQVSLVSQMLMDELLNVEPYQYILKIPVLVSVDTVSKVQIVSGEKNYQMEQGKDSWKLNDKDVTQKDFHTLYGELLDLLLMGEIEKDAMLSPERDPVLTVQYLRNMEHASDIEVKYYQYDEKSMSVSVNGQENFLVEKEKVQALQKKIVESF